MRTYLISWQIKLIDISIIQGNMYHSTTSLNSDEIKNIQRYILYTIVDDIIVDTCFYKPDDIVFLSITKLDD